MDIINLQNISFRTFSDTSEIVTDVPNPEPEPEPEPVGDNYVGIATASIGTPSVHAANPAPVIASATARVSTPTIIGSTGGGGGGGGTGELGLCPNTYDSFVASLNPRCLRQDNLSPGLVSFAASIGAQMMGLGDPLNMSLVNSYPSIGLWEYDNEPYYRGVDINAWAVECRNFGQTFKATYPSKTLIFPCYVQSDGGDYFGPDGFRPWVDYVFDAAPNIGSFYDGWGAHPYSSPRGAAPDFTDLDKIRGQLVDRGFSKNCWVTEVGWSVGGGGDQVSESTEAAYLADFVNEARTRSWITQIYYYCSHSWGTDFEPGFGLLNPNGTERIAANTFRSLV